jgi:hypothetical protein
MAAKKKGVIVLPPQKSIPVVVPPPLQASSSSQVPVVAQAPIVNTEEFMQRKRADIWQRIEWNNKLGQLLEEELVRCDPNWCDLDILLVKSKRAVASQKLSKWHADREEKRQRSNTWFTDRPSDIPESFADENPE